MRDLLRLDAPPNLSGSFEPDTRISFFDNNSQALRVSSDLWGNYQAAAESLAELVTTDAVLLERVLPAGLADDVTEQARVMIRELGRRAYRRVLSNEEVEAHVALFEEGALHFPEMDSFDAGARVLIEALLQSPYFVYRVENGVSHDGIAVALSDFEIASRLSYMLWNTMPDDTLLDEAERGTLGTPEQIAAQASRMLEADC